MTNTMLMAGLLLTAVWLPETNAVAQELGNSSAELEGRLVSEGLTRAQMVSLYASLAQGEFEPPACVPDSEMFTDVPAESLFCAWIEELARRGITGGCSPTQFCPGEPVTRAQMAAFIVRAQEFVPERTLRVTGSALKPRQDNVSRGNSASGGCLYVASGDAFTVFNTPVHLPQGARVDMLRMHFVDTATENSIAWFTAYTPAGELFDEWGVVSSGEAGSGSSDSEPIDHVIDNESFSYLLNYRAHVTGDVLQLCGLQIFYGG